MFRRDRGAIGGGLVIYVKDIYHCTRRSDLESISLECICSEIKQQYLKPLVLCYCYRPPSCNVSWPSDFSDSMEKCFLEQKECIILGDFNFDKLKLVGSSKVWLELNNQHFSIPYITFDFVYSQLIHLDISKSTGSDQISAKFLQMAAPIIAPALTQIFNLSISKAEFPSSFKLARVVPIHTKGPKLDYTNYRPISVLPITSLILERHVNLHLMAYLELNSLFYFRQSGLREHHSCQTALIKIIHDRLSAINPNKIAGSLFLDFSKAFDLVDHSLLIHKLKLYNIDTSYLNVFNKPTMLAQFLIKRR